jgi:hypothetical protein
MTDEIPPVLEANRNISERLSLYVARFSTRRPSWPMVDRIRLRSRGKWLGNLPNGHSGREHELTPESLVQRIVADSLVSSQTRSARVARAPARPQRVRTGSKIRFVVTGMEAVPKHHFPTRLIYRNTGGPGSG